jgi:hypothetical protein
MANHITSRPGKLAYSPDTAGSIIHAPFQNPKKLIVVQNFPGQVLMHPINFTFGKLMYIHL